MKKVKTSGVLTPIFQIPPQIPEHLMEWYAQVIGELSQDKHGLKLIPMLNALVFTKWAHEEDSTTGEALCVLVASRGSDSIKSLFVEAFVLQNGVYDKFLFPYDGIREECQTTFSAYPEGWKQHFLSACLYIQEKYKGYIPVWDHPSCVGPRPLA